MKNLQKTLIASTIAIAVLSCGIAAAQPAANEKHAAWATKVRKSVFTLLGHNMGPIGGMLKGKVPFNAEVVANNATNINQLANMIAGASKVDTSKFKVDTEALDSIWSQPEDYAKKIEALVSASSELSAIALNGDEKAVRKAMGAMGKTCGSCHDDYKKD
jgi:cytochrome c556